MNEGINLDIGPSWWFKQQPGGISIVKAQSTSFNRYVENEYSKFGNRRLIGLSYNGNKLSKLSITKPFDNIMNVTVYFNRLNNVFLLMKISTSAKSYYYTNHDTNQSIGEKAEFDDFVTTASHALSEIELQGILDELFMKGKLDYYELSTGLRERLVRGGGVILDLANHKHGMFYVSDETNIQVMVTEDYSVTGYKGVQHTPFYYQFWIKGIKNKNGEEIRVEGQFPNYPLNCIVYYHGDDNSYNNPLLVMFYLKENTYGDPIDVPSKYLMCKNNQKINWDVLRVKDSSIGDEELLQILENISTNNRLLVEKISDENLRAKLGDITRYITVDLTNTTKYPKPYNYESGTNRAEIPVYILVMKYINTFNTFTIGEIKMSDGIITGKQLPTPETKIRKLSAYYTDYVGKNLFLIEVIPLYTISSGSQKAVYYYYRDNNEWRGCKLETLVEIRDDGREDYRVTQNFVKYVVENQGKITYDDLKEQDLMVNLEPYPKIEEEEVPTENPTEEPTGPSTQTPKDTVDTELTSAKFPPPKGSGNAGAIVGGIIGTLVCTGAFSFVMWRIGPSLRTYMAGREPLLLSTV
ncbi:hypothetical protein BEWA_015830 [Theileria equi strain WA]|uniref:Uncharacterized protein n=1 Tax=Theileria equi strain WA TaxID=1537102 RepID=L1LC47_THEEQ|nr:hypothetical protein BEWA_015830 [Theileria equi strain WA]EKX73022.1 hypothetical protein BEWA_015830 [Theileria equi strain WA]|eukprot:XP_004832474.1 hypothetical protein BEWA_015830 [Theileria equi strain WA]